ncbi:hypothetical protein Tco_1134831 [Tanacetum coccineum]
MILGSLKEVQKVIPEEIEAFQSEDTGIQVEILPEMDPFPPLFDIDASKLMVIEQVAAQSGMSSRWQSMEDTLSKFMNDLAKRHEENSNLIKEIRALTDAAIRNQGASIKTFEIQMGEKMSKGSYGPQFSEAYSEASHFNNSIPESKKDLGVSFHFTLLYYLMFALINALVDIGMVYKGNNVIGALTNVPVFVRTFSIVTDFAVLEDIDAYRDEGMGDETPGDLTTRDCLSPKVKVFLIPVIGLVETEKIDELVEVFTSLEVLES